MGVTRSDIPAGLSAGVKALFLKSLEQAPTQFQKLAMVLDSTKSEEKYSWLSAVPGMREFIDERHAEGLREYAFTVPNKTWESTIEVERTALEDEQYGQIRLRVQSLAEAAVRHKDQIVLEFVRDGFSGVGYDGEAFFSGSHPTGAGTQGNVGSAELSAAALQAAISQMAKLKDDSGRPVGVLADTLVVGPDLEWKALELLSSVLNPDAGTNAANVLRGRLGLVVSPHLTAASDWFVFATKGVLKPLILQERTAVEFEALDAHSGSGDAFMRDRFYYGVRARYNAGYGLWQLAWGSHPVG